MLENKTNTFNFDKALVDDIVTRATHTKAMADYLNNPNTDSGTRQCSFELSYAMDQAKELTRQIGYLHDEGEWNADQVITSLYDMPAETLEPIISRMDANTRARCMLNDKLLNKHLQDHAEDLLRCISEQVRRTEADVTHALQSYKASIMRDFAADGMDASTATDKLTGSTKFITYEIDQRILPGVTIIRDSLDATYMYVQYRGAWTEYESLENLTPNDILTASNPPISIPYDDLF